MRCFLFFFSSIVTNMLFFDTLSTSFGSSFEIFVSTFSFYTWLWASTSTTTVFEGLPLLYIIARLW